MEKGQKVSRETLTKKGWGLVTRFAKCEVWGNNGDRVLWCPKDEEILLTYKSKGD